MKILLSSYSFGAYRGSEAGVGWNVALGLARRGHQVTVITTHEFGASNHRAIESEGVAIRLLEEDCGVTCYASTASYRTWQKRIGKVIRQEVREQPYDVIHHVTFNQYRNIHDVFAAGSPYVIGPIGGAELVPMPLLRYGELPIKMRIKELMRYVEWDALPLALRCRRSKARGYVLASNVATARRLRHLPASPQVCPAIAIHEHEIVEQPPLVQPEKAYILFDGGLSRPQKGTWLALRTIQHLWSRGKCIPLRMVGIPAADVQIIRRYAQSISLPSDALHLEPSVSRSQMLEYMQHAAMMFSCVFRDSGSMALLEALAQGCPVVCLDIPSQQWLPGEFSCKVQVQPTSIAMEQTLADALSDTLSRQRLPDWHARRCAWLRREMTWSTRLDTLEQLYRQAVSTP